MSTATAVRTTWQRRADRRWPDDWDMIEPAIGSGRWASVSWCGPLTVHLHRTRALAASAIEAIGSGCGHGCSGDHELVDLADPSRSSGPSRSSRRIAHLEACPVCRFVFDGRAAAAGRRRR
jgi:hypothetical protein